MCGIFAVVGDKTGNASQTVLAGLKHLEYRGYDSWGVAMIPANAKKISVEKHVGKIGGAKIRLPKGSIGLGHTRWATHGGVTDENAHPHLDCTKTVAVIHNGIIENHLDLKKKLKNKKHKFNSETDTEVVAHLLEERIKTKPFHKTVMEVFNLLVGSNAIVVLDMRSCTIMSCRNGSPIVAGFGNDEYFLASDVTPFLDKTQRVLFMADGEAIELSKEGVKLFDLKSQKEKKYTIQTLDWKIEDAQKSGYPHYLLKEIMEQKTMIEKTASLNEKTILQVAKKINEGFKIVMVGCGTASYCALATKYFFAEVGIETQSFGAYEFMPYAKFCDKKTLFIAISQSGETADTLICAKAAKAGGSTIVAVVNALGSSLERMSDYVLPVGAGPEIAVVSTKAFTSQLATLYQLVYAAVGKYNQARNKIKKMVEALSLWLNDKLTDQIIALAKSLIDHEDMYLIGKHINYPATLEFALKIKETSYIHAEPFAAGELKHGVITLIQKGTTCFVIASNDEARDEILSSAAQLSARGGDIVGIAPFESPEFDRLIKTPDLAELTIFPNIIVGQLLGYYLGIGRGTDPDKPRNLAKSVTVK